MPESISYIAFAKDSGVANFWQQLFDSRHRVRLSAKIICLSLKGSVQFSSVYYFKDSPTEI